MEIDDEVVMELDVVLNSPQELNLLQYPLRPRYRPYGDQGTLLSGTISKDALSLHYSISTNSTNYDRGNSEFKRETQVLTGRTINPLTKYCVGIVRDGVLCLTPLDQLMQVRPDTGYLDAVLDKKHVEDKEETAQIKQEKDSKKLRVFKKKTVKAVVEAAVETNLSCFDMKSIESIECFHCLLPQVKSGGPIKTSENYLNSILPTPLKPTGLRDNLRALPISIAIEELLKRCIVINIEEIQEIFPSEKNIEYWLIQKAFVVDGRWVCKSEIIGDCFGREACVYLLWKNLSVSRAE